MPKTSKLRVGTRVLPDAGSMVIVELDNDNRQALVTFTVNGGADKGECWIPFAALEITPIN